MPRTKVAEVAKTKNRTGVRRTRVSKDLIDRLLAEHASDYYYIEAKPLSARMAPMPALEGQLAVDVVETEREMVVIAAVAGVAPEELQIAVAPDMVTIRGERHRVIEEGAGDHILEECYWGPFSRTIILPQAIEPHATRALFKNGILLITLPKERAGKSIPIIVVDED